MPSKETDYEPRYTAGPGLLGSSVRKRREVLQITQEEVAEKFGGPSVASMRTIENAQAASYRSKTLFSLDRALGWPRGTSTLLMTGDISTFSGDLVFGHQQEVVDELFMAESANKAAGIRAFDQFVDYVPSAISDEEMEFYNIPVARFEATDGAEPKRPTTPTDEEVADDLVSQSSRWSRSASSRIEFARYMLSEHRRISGRGERAALFDILIVAVNQLSLDDLENVQKVTDAARIVREAELKIDQDFANSAMIIPEIEGASSSSIIFSPTADDSRAMSDLMFALAEKLAIWGQDGER